MSETSQVGSIAFFNLQDTSTGSQFIFVLNSELNAAFTNPDALLKTLSHSFISFNTTLDFSQLSGGIPVTNLPRSRFVEEDYLIERRDIEKRYDLGVGDDVAYVFGGNDTVYGRAGDDRIVALSGSGNGLSGGNGADIIKFKGTANGWANGGDGVDRVIGNDQDNELGGGVGADVVIGLGGDDHMTGGFGDDFVYGGRGDDRISGDEDPVYGFLEQHGNDVIHGNRGADMIWGNGGSDRLFGGANNDELMGGTGVDYLLGGNGDDILDGGFGDDHLTGGQGRDVFIYVYNSNQPLEESYGYDRVRDFEFGLDIIEFHGMGSLDFEAVMSYAAQTSHGVRFKFEAGSVLFINDAVLTDFSEADFGFA